MRFELPRERGEPPRFVVETLLTCALRGEAQFQQLLQRRGVERRQAAGGHPPSLRAIVPRDEVEAAGQETVERVAQALGSATLDPEQLGHLVECQPAARFSQREPQCQQAFGGRVARAHRWPPYVRF